MKPINQPCGGIAMKKWIWLLALPYGVTIDTQSHIDLGMPEIAYRVGTMPCHGTKEECEDLAEALNEAHVKKILDELKQQNPTMGEISR